MAHDFDKIQEILTKIELGEPITTLEKEYYIPRQTINRWKNKYKNDDDNITLKNLKRQLNHLSKKEPNEAITRQIANITNAIKRIENKISKIKRATKKPKPEPKNVIDNREIEELKQKMLNDEYGLFKYQQNFLKDTSRARVWLKSRQIGATYVCSGEALINCYGGLDQLIVSASHEQASKWYEEIKVHAKKLGIKIDGSQTKVRVGNNIIYILANNYRTIQGFSGDVWIDEFAWMQHPKRIFNAILPAISVVKAGERVAKITIMSTPFEDKSIFHDMFHNEDKYNMFSRHRTTIYDAIKDGLEFDIEFFKALLDSESFAMAYECQFADDSLAFFPVSLIKSCINYEFTYHEPPRDKVIYSGYDIGRVKDLSALAGVYLEDKYKLSKLDIFEKMTFKSQKVVIKDFLKANPKAFLNIDMTGIGRNLAEDIESEYPDRVNGISFTAYSKENMVLTLKKLFEDKLIELPNDPALISDIHSIKRKAGQKRMLYDSDRNEYGHADRFWALALATKQLKVFSEVSSEEDFKSGGGAMIC